MTTAEKNKSTQRKRVSKNRKKNWRKHTDVVDVEEYYEDKWLQERTGGLAAEKKDEELFFVDTAVKTVEPATGPLKRKKLEAKALKCHSLLEPDPRIKPATVKHNVRRESLRKRCRQIQERVGSGSLTATERHAAGQRKEVATVRRVTQEANRTLPVVKQDLWADNKDSLPSEDEKGYFAAIPAKKAKKAPAHYRERPSQIPAIETPHPGASYNPTFADHQALLQKALGTEVKKHKAEAKVTRALDAMFPSKADAPTEETWVTEMSAGLFDEDEDEAEKEDPRLAEAGDAGEAARPSEDRLSTNPPVRREDKKTRRQRNREKAQKLKEKSAKLGKLAKITKKEQTRLKSIKAQVKLQEKDLELRSQRKAALKEMYKNKPKKLGKLKYSQPDLEIKLSDELEGSLRLLKPEGDLLEDRFHSLQRRNIIEPRTKAKFTRKYKPKEFEKRGHRAVKID